MNGNGNSGKSRCGEGGKGRVHEIAAHGWENMEKGKTANPFRLFFKRPKK